MSKSRIAVLKVVTKGLSVTAAAAKYGYSRSTSTDCWPGTAKTNRTRSNPVPAHLTGRATPPARTFAKILSTHTIEPDEDYWRNTQRTPGRWPGAL